MGRGLMKEARQQEQQRKRKAEADAASKNTSKLSRRQAGSARSCMNVVQEKALEWIIDHLKEKPDEILMCKGMLESGQCSQEVVETSAVEKECFHETYMTFKSLPRYWMAEWLTNHCEFSHQWVDLVDAGGPGQIRQLFTYIIGVADSTYWPRPLLRKTLLTRFLAWSSKELGQRWKDFERNVDGTGKINWSATSPITFTWVKHGEDGARIDKVTHKSSNTTVEVKDVIITGEHKLLQPWDDMRAQFEGTSSIKPVVADLFPPSSAWRAFFAKKNFQEHAKTLQDKYEENEKRQVKGEQDILQSAKKKQTEAARAAAKARAPNRKVSAALSVSL